MDHDQSRNALRAIAWHEITPWLIIFRSFRLAISMPILLFATAGAILTPMGWQVGQVLFAPGAAGEQYDDQDAYFRAESELHTIWPDAVSNPDRFTASHSISASQRIPTGLTNAVAVYSRFVVPFRRLGDRDGTIRSTAFYLFGGIWNVVVWAFVAGVITRVAVVKLGRDERVGVGEALLHVKRNYGWYLIAPFFPQVGIVVAAVPLAGSGLLVWWFGDTGILLLGLLWPLVLVGGLIMAVLLVGLVFGWPLMWPTISSEPGSDAFEAFSRSYSYTLQRPLHYLFYASLVTVFGGVCWLLVSHFAEALTQASLWAVSWGAGGEQLDAIEDSAIVHFFGLIVQSVLAGFNYAFFFVSASAVYLLLRRDVDQTDFDEVFLNEDERFGIPPSTTATAAERPADETADSGPETADSTSANDDSGTAANSSANGTKAAGSTEQDSNRPELGNSGD